MTHIKQACSRGLDIANIQRPVERGPVVFLVGEIDVDRWMCEEHACVLEACGLCRHTCKMEYGAAECVQRIHLERGGNVLACPRLAGAGALAGLRVGGGAVPVEEALECLLVAKVEIDMEEGHAALLEGELDWSAPETL